VTSFAGLTPHQEAAFVGGYALFLVGVAAALGWAARRSHARVLRVKAIGFRYHQAFDAWQCSEGTYLWRIERDEKARLVRYRAKAEMCNACPLKNACTDSNDGRELLRPMDAWPHTEMARFQGVISLVLILLAGVLVVVEAGRQADPRLSATFGGAALPCFFLVRREIARLRAVRTALPR
jgi:hypothetical protein